MLPVAFPKLLWLQYDDKGRRIDNVFIFLVESGNNVEQVAYRLFPGGILVNAGYSSLNELCARTEKVMRANQTICFNGISMRNHFVYYGCPE